MKTPRILAELLARQESAVADLVVQSPGCMHAYGERHLASASMCGKRLGFSLIRSLATYIVHSCCTTNYCSRATCSNARRNGGTSNVMDALHPVHTPAVAFLQGAVALPQTSAELSLTFAGNKHKAQASSVAGRVDTAATSSRRVGGEAKRMLLGCGGPASRRNRRESGAARPAHLGAKS